MSELTVPRPFEIKTPDVMENEPELTFPISVPDALGSQMNLKPHKSDYVESSYFNLFSNHERFVGVLLIIVAVSLLILSEVLAEPERSIYSRNIRFLLAIGIIFSLFLIAYSVYGTTNVATGYAVAGFIVLVLLLSISHRVGYAMSIYVSVLLLVLIIGLIAITKSLILILPLILSFVWIIYVIDKNNHIEN